MRDTRDKYIDMGTNFGGRASEIEFYCKQSNRICELLANRLASVKPKTPAEFENNEHWKDFVMKTVTNNEKVIDLLVSIKTLLGEVSVDSEALCQGAKLNDTIRFQSETIEGLLNAREVRIDEIKRIHKAKTELSA